MKLRIDDLVSSDDADRLAEDLVASATAQQGDALVEATAGVCRHLLGTLGTFSSDGTDLTWSAEEQALQQVAGRLELLGREPTSDGRTEAMRELLGLFEDVGDPGFARAVGRWLADPRVAPSGE